MTLEPLLAAPALVQVHTFISFAVVALGALQFLAPKGTFPHRTVGWIWAVLVTAMMVTAFMNHDILSYGPFSPQICCRDLSCRLGSFKCGSIHILSVFIVLILPYAVLQARLHDVFRHGQAMILLMTIIVLGGILTTLPPRIMHDVVFGG